VPALPWYNQGNAVITCGQRMDMTPFWPCRDENLSPMMGLRVNRRVIATRLMGSRPFLPLPAQGESTSAKKKELMLQAPVTVYRL